MSTTVDLHFVLSRLLDDFHDRDVERPEQQRKFLVDVHNTFFTDSLQYFLEQNKRTDTRRALDCAKELSHKVYTAGLQLMKEREDAHACEILEDFFTPYQVLVCGTIQKYLDDMRDSPFQVPA